MKFSVRMFPQMVLHVLYLEKENKNVPYHLPEKRVAPVEKQMKRSILSGTFNCGQMVQKFPGILVKTRKRNFRKFHSSGKCSVFWLIKPIVTWRRFP